MKNKSLFFYAYNNPLIFLVIFAPKQLRLLKIHLSLNDRKPGLLEKDPVEPGLILSQAFLETASGRDVSKNVSKINKSAYFRLSLGFSLDFKPKN
jgi:hypothetical protein